jgi:hypothetical protein
MSEEQLPAEPADPAAPYGRRPDGTPYKRDPGPFVHLRKGTPVFGRNNTTAEGAKAPERRPTAGKAKPAPRATVKEPPKHTAAQYRDKIEVWIRTGAGVLSKRQPVPAAIVAVRAEEMAKAWGEVAIAYPAVGRFIDRTTTGGVLANALTSTGTTLVMIAHLGGYTKGLPFYDLIDDAVSEALDKFATGAEFARMRERQQAAMMAALTEQGATDATTSN